MLDSPIRHDCFNAYYGYKHIHIFTHRRGAARKNHIQGKTLIVPRRLYRTATFLSGNFSKSTFPLSRPQPKHLRYILFIFFEHSVLHAIRVRSFHSFKCQCAVNFHPYFPCTFWAFWRIFLDGLILINAQLWGNSVVHIFISMNLFRHACVYIMLS